MASVRGALHARRKHNAKTSSWLAIFAATQFSRTISGLTNSSDVDVDRNAHHLRNSIAVSQHLRPSYNQNTRTGSNELVMRAV